MDSINSSSLPFDPFAAPFGASESSHDADFSPTSLFIPLEDFAGPDLTSDSAGSPSPVSPGLSASSYGYPTTDEWTNWDSLEHSPEPDVLFKSEPFASPLLSAMPPKRALTPAVNPMDLTMPTAYPLSYGTLPQALQNQALFFHQQPQVHLAQVPAPVLPSCTAPTNQDNARARRYPKRSLKRKSDDEDDEEDDDQPSPKRQSLSPPSRGSADKATVPQKKAHNMIEKRYRTNINKKIEELRDTVPELRAATQREEGNGDVEDHALPPVTKLNKATILAKAAEYIKQLERKVSSLEVDNSALNGRMQKLQSVLYAQQQPQAQRMFQAQAQMMSPLMSPPMMPPQRMSQAQAQMMSQAQPMSPLVSSPVMPPQRMSQAQAHAQMMSQAQPMSPLVSPVMPPQMPPWN